MVSREISNRTYITYLLIYCFVIITSYYFFSYYFITCSIIKYEGIKIVRISIWEFNNIDYFLVFSFILSLQFFKYCTLIVVTSLCYILVFDNTDRYLSVAFAVCLVCIELYFNTN